MFKGLKPVTFMVIFCMVFSCTVAQAALTGSNTVSIIASDNACIYFVSSTGQPDQNEATIGLRSLDKSSAGGYYHSFMRFRLGDLSSAKGVFSAQLRLYKVSESGTPLPVAVYAMTNGLAGETTWTSVMSWDQGTNVFYAARGDTSYLDKQTPGTNGTYMTFDLSAKMFNLITNDTNGEITFFLRSNYSTGSGYTQFHSLESTTDTALKPTLTVSADFGPPKGTVLTFR
jgi:hypothetical protein